MNGEFWGAYGDVLCDEYGWPREEREKGEGEGEKRYDDDDDDDDEGSAKDLGDVPIVGLGHSLGARILAVMDAYPEEISRPPRSQSRPRQRRRRRRNHRDDDDPYYDDEYDR